MYDRIRTLYGREEKNYQNAENCYNSYFASDAPEGHSITIISQARTA